MDDPNVWSLVIQGIAALSGLGAVVVAWLGLTTWHIKLAGETQHDIARRLLRAVYIVRERVKPVRSRLITGGEIELALEEAGMDEGQLEGPFPHGSEGTAVVYERRWHQVDEAMTDVELEALEAEAVWGSEAQEAIEPLRECMNRMFALLNQYILDLTDDRPADENTQDVRRRLFRGADERDGEEDELGERLAAAIRNVEEFARPHLKPPRYEQWPLTLLHLSD